MPKKDSVKTQRPRRAVQSKVPQRGSTEQSPREAVQSIVPKRGSAEHSAPKMAVQKHSAHDG